MSNRNRSWLWPKWSNWHHDGSPFYKVSKLAPDLKAFYHTPEGHLMPQWRPKWDMAKKNLKLGWAMGLRSLQDDGLPWGDKPAITILFCWKCCSSDFTATSRSSSRCSCSKWIARSTLPGVVTKAPKARFQVRLILSYYGWLSPVSIFNRFIVSVVQVSTNCRCPVVWLSQKATFWRGTFLEVSGWCFILTIKH